MQKAIQSHTLILGKIHLQTVFIQFIKFMSKFDKNFVFGRLFMTQDALVLKNEKS